MKEYFIGVSVATILYGILLYISVLIKRPILCSNLSIVFIISGSALRGLFEPGSMGFDFPIILSVLLVFASLIYIVGGLKYQINTDMDSLKEKLMSLEFKPEEYIYNNKVHSFKAPNGTKLFAKQYSRNKFIEISMTNGFQFKKINETRKSILPFIRQYNAISNLKFNSLLFILLGLILLGIGLIIK